MNPAAQAFARVADVYERASELQLARKLAAALQREVEPRQPDHRVAELLFAEVPPLLVELLDVEAVALQAVGARRRGNAFGVQ